MGHTHFSVIAVAGPSALLDIATKDLRTMYDEVHTFEIPDDHGDFPDTSGYIRKNWDHDDQGYKDETGKDVWDAMVGELQEDPSLYQAMCKCMDCALDFSGKRTKTVDRLGFRDIKETIHWPRFGGKIFAVTGHVTAVPPAEDMDGIH